MYIALRRIYLSFPVAFVIKVWVSMSSRLLSVLYSTLHSLPADGFVIHVPGQPPYIVVSNRKKYLVEGRS